ncbi:hypothetical protein EVG20_g5543 [Dentipellis fragilis]|uniref:Uncharacterized protein n=1 Tax=Dentipellis fragilis TaxID=205917 RepID=A0A4Y9YSL4_9AGAM|nr:hypothetical protein EVG20_g5543 [Dentipellis fragilis]
MTVWFALLVFAPFKLVRVSGMEVIWTPCIDDANVGETNFDRSSSSTNDFTPGAAARLLPDVLIYIFSEAQEYLDRSLIDTFPNPILRLGWILVTHVCRHWRHVALGCPYLWKTIYLDLGPRWADLILSRTNSIPLYVNVNTQGDELKEWQIQCISTSAPHISELTVGAPAPSLEAMLSKFTPASHDLNTLVLVVVDKIIWHPRSIVRLTDFLDKVQGLKHLRLNNVFLPWSSPVFTNLISLDLSLTPDILPEECRPSMMQLFEILETMHSLECLALFHLLPHALDPGDKNPQYRHEAPRAFLPYLTELCLAGRLLEFTQVADNIIFPSTACLAVSITYATVWELANRTHILSQTLLHHISPRTPKPTALIRVSLQIFDTQIFLTADDAASSSQVMNLRMCLNSGHNYKEFFEELVSGMQFAEHAEFILDIDEFSAGSPLSQTAWTSIFGDENMNNIRTVYLRRPSLFPFYFRGDETERDEEEPWVSSIFQGLNQITFEDVNFKRIGGDEICDDIITILEQREELGIPIDRVTFSRCTGIDGAWLRALKKVFPDQVSWDESTEKKWYTFIDADGCGSTQHVEAMNMAYSTIENSEQYVWDALVQLCNPDGGFTLSAQPQLHYSPPNGRRRPETCEPRTCISECSTE